MSTPNPTHILAEHRYFFRLLGVEFCQCGWKGADHATHVVSKLTDAGYSIVEISSEIQPGRFSAADLYAIARYRRADADADAETNLGSPA